MTHAGNQEGKALWVVLVLLVVAALAVYYFYFLGKDEIIQQPVAPLIPERTTLPEPAPDQQEIQPEPEPAPETIAEDIGEELIEEPDPLPQLGESDQEALSAARDLLGESPTATYLVPEGLISKFVATIDALTNEELPGNIVPVRGPGGEMQATSDGETDEVNPETGLPDPLFVLDPVNFQRYTAQVEVLEAIDADDLAENYDHYYPLLQQAYRELGYTEGEFTDRLLEVIDELLATPEPEYPVRLLKPEAFYVFVDPALESLSAGQKLLIRMGPSNAARVKEKLREFRAVVQTQGE